MYDFIDDEDIPKPIVEKLSESFEVFYIEEEMKGSTDEEVMEKSRKFDTPIFTFDNDFFQYSSHPGIMHITQRTSYTLIVKAVEDIRKEIDKEEIKNSVIRVNPSLYRDKLP